MNNNTLTVDYRKIEDLFSEIEEMKFELEGIVFAAKSMERTLSLASQQVQQMLSDGSGDGSDNELEEEMLMPE
jgi:putative IMPACT (imprinted ancient) family translation regulator